MVKSHILCQRIHVTVTIDAEVRNISQYSLRPEAMTSPG